MEKVLRGKQCTERMHEIPKSYGKFNGLAASKSISVKKLWSLVPPEVRSNILLAAKKNAEDITNGATASKQCNSYRQLTLLCINCDMIEILRQLQRSPILSYLGIFKV